MEILERIDPSGELVDRACRTPSALIKRLQEAKKIPELSYCLFCDRLRKFGMCRFLPCVTGGLCIPTIDKVFGISLSETDEQIKARRSETLTRIKSIFEGYKESELEPFECKICYEYMDPRTAIKLDCCNKTWCCDCVLRVIKDNSRCPNCRQWEAYSHITKDQELSQIARELYRSKPKFDICDEECTEFVYFCDRRRCRKCPWLRCQGCTVLNGAKEFEEIIEDIAQKLAFITCMIIRVNSDIDSRIWSNQAYSSQFLKSMRILLEEHHYIPLKEMCGPVLEALEKVSGTPAFIENAVTVFKKLEGSHHRCLRSDLDNLSRCVSVCELQILQRFPHIFNFVNLATRNLLRKIEVSFTIVCGKGINCVSIGACKEDFEMLIKVTSSEEGAKIQLKSVQAGYIDGQASSDYLSMIAMDMEPQKELLDFCIDALDIGSLDICDIEMKEPDDFIHLLDEAPDPLTTDQSVKLGVIKPLKKETHICDFTVKFMPSNLLAKEFYGVYNSLSDDQE